MPKLTLNKSIMQKEKGKLDLYERLLPSLDLKRRQLAIESSRAEKKLKEAQASFQEVVHRTVEQIPMIADPELDVRGIVKIDSVRVEEENVVGVRLPLLKDIQWTVREYSLLATPACVDGLVAGLKKAAQEQIVVRIEEERVRRLKQANRRITQRINLFEKILIPEAKQNIRKIQIFLGDAAVSAVVRAKLAKGLHERERTEAAAARAG